MDPSTLLLLDSLVMLLLGILDYVKGETTYLVVFTVLAAGFMLYLLLPPQIILPSLIVGVILAAIILLLVLRGGIGTMDLVIAPRIPLLAFTVVSTSKPVIAFIAGAIAGFMLHYIRVRSALCNGNIMGRTLVRTDIASEAWWVNPVGVGVEDYDTIEEIKRKWKHKAGCVEAQVGYPLVFIFSAGYALALLSLYLP